ncbi:hypothetical protein, partial [Eisenbergiella porci]|uniref:hypothetical protein n=1 Tax=Eisenbergiella porci TaxID=2652274 RepID=UPI002A9196C4
QPLREFREILADYFTECCKISFIQFSVSSLFSPCHDKFSPLRKTFFYFIMHRLNLQCLSVIFVREIFAFQSWKAQEDV